MNRNRPVFLNPRLATHLTSAQQINTEEKSITNKTPCPFCASIVRMSIQDVAYMYLQDMLGKARISEHIVNIYLFIYLRS